MRAQAPADDTERDLAAMKPPSRARILGRMFGALATLLLALVLLLSLGSNGLTLSGLALGALMLAILLLTVVRPPAARSRRIALLTTAGSCLFFVSTFVFVRLFTEPPPQAFRFAENGRRDAHPPWLSRLLDERETALAGLSFSGALGLVRGREKEHLGELLREAYSTSQAPWPNAILIESSSGYARHLEHIPVGAKNVPCLVFLHGFGGQLTAYLRVLDRSFGDRYAIVAPFLDSTGAFWSPRGKAVVRALVTEHLPPEVARGRVFLIGLSNGAVGATAILQDPELSRLFRGFVLVSGVGEVSGPKVEGNVLLIAGTDDPRFPFTYLESGADALRGSGAQVELAALEADHFLWLSHAKEMTTTLDGWLSARLAE